jgi:hypothetical protein
VLWLLLLLAGVAACSVSVGQRRPGVEHNGVLPYPPLSVAISILGNTRTTRGGGRGGRDRGRRGTTVVTLVLREVLPADQSKSARKNTTSGGPFARWLATIVVATASCATSREDARTATAGMRPPRFGSGSMRQRLLPGTGGRRAGFAAHAPHYEPSRRRIWGQLYIGGWLVSSRQRCSDGGMRATSGHNSVSHFLEVSPCPSSVHVQRIKHARRTATAALDSAVSAQFSLS